MKRMAIAFWKSERAERIEVALFDAAPKLRPPQAGFEWEVADPLTTFDLKRFNAVRGYQAQQGRELSRCLKELRLLRRERARGMHGRTRAHVAEGTRAPARTRQRRRVDPAPARPTPRVRRVAEQTRARRGGRAARGHQRRARPAARRRRLAGPGPPRRHRRPAAAGPRPGRPRLAGGARPRPVPYMGGHRPGRGSRRAVAGRMIAGRSQPAMDAGPRLTLPHGGARGRQAGEVP